MTTTAAVRMGRDYRLNLFDVGLACCAVEYSAATLDADAFAAAAQDLLGEDVDPHAPLETAHVLVVSGTVTARTAPAVRALYDAMPEPRHVISFGSCANSGGPYWDSYSVVAGIESLVPVDLFVPGCPPRPETLLDALRQLEARDG